MFDSMLKDFASSSLGQDALAALQKQGVSVDEATKILDSAVPAASEAMVKQTEGQANPGAALFDIFGGHAGRSFLEGMVAGLLRGDGIVGSLEDGGMGLIGGHISEVLADRLGMDASKASMITSVITPFIARYAHDKLSG